MGLDERENFLEGGFAISAGALQLPFVEFVDGDAVLPADSDRRDLGAVDQLINRGKPDVEDLLDFGRGVVAF